MATKDPTQKAKLPLRALPLSFTIEETKDYYLRPKLQKCLNLDDLADEVAALSTRQEDPEDIARTGRQLMQRMMWYLSSGYSITLPIGYFRPSVQGVFMEGELNVSPDRKRLTLAVVYSMSKEMREALAEAEIDVEILKSASGPQLFSVISAQDAQNPDAVTRGEGVPIEAGQTCIIKGRNLKVGGEGDEIGVTLTRVDGSAGTSYFFPVKRLYPNTKTQVGFIMPADAPEGSVWSVKLCTQLSNNGVTLLKEPRTVVMDTDFVVGEEATDIPGGGGGTQPGGGSEPGSGDDGSFG